MICDPCEKQLKKPGRHRRHRGCTVDVFRGYAAGPCWCPACHQSPSVRQQEIYDVLRDLAWTQARP